MRIVQLYEVDFNSMLKLMLGKRLMSHGDMHGLNGRQLYGSRKGKAINDALVTVKVVYDMARSQKDYLLSVFDDLKGNCDRVQPALNMATTREMVLPKQ